MADVQEGPTITQDFVKKHYEGWEHHLKCDCGWEENVIGDHAPHQIATIHLLEEHAGLGGVKKVRDVP